jgi:hypothetical protein
MGDASSRRVAYLKAEIETTKRNITSQLFPLDGQLEWLEMAFDELETLGVKPVIKEKVKNCRKALTELRKVLK